MAEIVPLREAVAGEAGGVSAAYTQDETMAVGAPQCVLTYESGTIGAKPAPAALRAKGVAA